MRRFSAAVWRRCGEYFPFICRAMHYSCDKGAGWNKNMISLVFMSGRWNGWEMESTIQVE